MVLEVLRNGTAIRYISCEVELQEKRMLDKCVVEVPSTVSVSVGDDLKVKHTASGKYLFGGKVAIVEDMMVKKRVTAYPYSKVLLEKRMLEKSYTNASPESIVQDIINTYTDLTWSSTWSSGITLTRYVAYGNLMDVVSELATIAGADYWSEVDTSGTKRFYFQPASLNNLNITYYLATSGSNKANAVKEAITRDESTIINALELFGKTKETSETYTYSVMYASIGYLMFAVPTKNIKIFVNDNMLIEGQDYRYVIRPLGIYSDVPYVEFSPSIQGLNTNPVKVEIYYDLDQTPVAYREDQTSINTYGKRNKSLQAITIDNESDLEALAAKIIALYKDPRLTVKINAPINPNVKTGGYIRIIDPITGLDSNLVVRSVKYKIPEGTMSITLNQIEPELYELEKEISRKVETASKSYSIMTKKILYRKYYLSGDGTSSYPYTFTINSRDAKYSYGYQVPGTASDFWLNCDLQIIGSTTWTFTRVGYAYLSGFPNVVRILHGTPIYLSPSTTYSADNNNQITFKLQIFCETSYGGTRQLIAPNPSNSSQYFQYTESGVKKLRLTSIGIKYFLLRESDYDCYLYWGYQTDLQYYPSCLFNIGFEVV